MISNAFRRTRARLKDESGFTLIELLIVIVILGVLAGIVVFSGSGDHRPRRGVLPARPR